MNKSGRKFLGLVLLLVLLAIPAGVVFAKELGAMTISGPGIKGEVTLKDPDLLHKVETSGFLEPSKIVKNPQGLGEGYLMTLFLNMEEGAQPWLQVTYYPTAAGEGGYFNLVDLMAGAPEGSNGQWYQAAPQAESTLRALLAGAGVSLAIPQAAPKESNAASAPLVEKQPAVSSASGSAPAEPAQAAQVAAPAPVETATTPELSLNMELILGLGLSAALLLAFLSIRWLAAQRKINA